MPALTNSTQLRHMDPSALLIDSNIRTDLALDAAFVDSIRQHGVIVPVVAVLQPDGRVRVRDGNRRTAGAIDAGRDTIPVVVFDTDDVASDRIAEQIVANTQRAGLTATDTVAAVEQLAWLGVDASTIAKRTSLPRASVDQALTVAGSQTTRGSITEGFTLEMAAWLAEVEDDPQVWEELRERFTNRPETARHDYERYAQSYRDRAALRVAAEQLATEMPAVTAYEGDVWGDPKAYYLHDLVDGEGNILSRAKHRDCPGHAYSLSPWRKPDGHTTIRVKDGQVVDSKTSDATDIYVGWLCTDWKKHGHRDRWRSGSRTDSDNPTAEPSEAAEQRRRVIALNKAGQAALTVRREWLTAFTTTLRTPPKDAPAFMWLGLAAAHIAAHHDVADGVQHVTQLLNTPGNRTQAFETWIAKQPQTALAHMALCARLWSYEHRADKTIWRETGQQRAAYLRAIERWGYQLSDVEKVCTGDLTEEQAYTALTGDPS